MDPNEAAIRIQKNFKGYEVRKKHPGLLKPEHLDRQSAKLAKLYTRKWKSKTVFQVLLMLRAKMFQEFSNFSQQVHLYNQHVIYTMTTYKRYEAVGTDRVDKNLTYKEFIGEPKQILFRLPFQLNHRSTYTTDLNFDPFAPKWKLFGENEDWDAPLNVPRLKSERQHVVTSHILNVKDRGIQADLLKNGFDNDEAETNVVYHYSNSFPQIENEYIGNHLKRNISVYSVQNDRDEGKAMTAVDTYDGYRNNNFTRVFMQLMCPSCCGGLFSETKGSVYMKRPSTRKSKTTSVATTISEAPINDNDSSNDVAGNENENETAISIPKQELTVVNESPELLVEDTNSPESQGKQCRSMSLGDTISHSLTQELNQNLFNEGEIISWNNKLRKTSLHVPEEEEKKTDQNTVIELKIRGKEHVQVVKQNGNDDPPFNFQAILRKTNNRPSLKRTSIMDEDEIKEKYSASRRTSNASSDNYFSSELFPGITLEGVVYDL